MSPVAPSSGHATRALTLTFVAILVGMALLWGASSLLTSRHNSRAPHRRLGGVVDLGKATSLSKQISRGDGVPLFFPDVSGNKARSVWLAHRGTDPATGWSAFLAQVPGKDPSCLWSWDAKADELAATCDRSLRRDRMGSGLTHYPVTIVKGRLRVDLTVAATAGTTTTAPAP